MKVKKSEFNIGDWIWYYYPRKYEGRSPKWQKLYTGPFLVMRTIPPVNFVLQKSHRSTPFVVHVDKIKRCFGETPKSWLPITGDDVTTQEVREETITQPSPVVQASCQDPAPKYSRRRSKGEERTEVGDFEVELGRPRRENRRPPAHLEDYRW